MKKSTRTSPPPPQAMACDLTALRNLGPSSARMLLQAGVCNAQQLHALGAIKTYVKVKQCGLAPSLNLLWAIEGALTDRPWQDVARDDRTTLLLALEDAQKGLDDVPQPSK